VQAFEILFDYETIAQRTNKELHEKSEDEENSEGELCFEPQELKKNSKVGKKENFQSCNSSERETNPVPGVRWDDSRKRWIVRKRFKIGKDWQSRWGGSFKKDDLEDAKRALSALKFQYAKGSDPKLHCLSEKEEITTEIRKNSSKYIGVCYNKDTFCV
jgi:hypothetical protein